MVGRREKQERRSADGTMLNQGNPFILGKSCLTHVDRTGSVELGIYPLRVMS